MTTPVEESSEDTTESNSSSDDFTEEIIPVTSNLLISIEERKKIFVDNESSMHRSPSKMAWKSMPSLNKSSVTKSIPLPLVGSNYPSQKEDIQMIEPVKKIKQNFEKSRLSLPKFQIITNNNRRRSSSLGSNSSSTTSNSSLSNSIETTNQNVNKQLTSADNKFENVNKQLTSADNKFENDNKQPMSVDNKYENVNKQPQKSPVIYRWDDESNGEIYTDRPNNCNNSNDTLNENDFTQTNEIINSNSIGLYVVENGKEYPLLPISQRKSLFEANPSMKLNFKTVHIPSTTSVSTSNINKVEVRKEFNHSRGLNLGPPAQQSNALPTEQSANKDEFVTKPTKTPMEQQNKNRNLEPPVKSSSVPYILEEQEILQKIDLVSKIKTKFVV